MSTPSRKVRSPNRIRQGTTSMSRSAAISGDRSAVLSTTIFTTACLPSGRLVDHDPHRRGADVTGQHRAVLYHRELHRREKLLQPLQEQLGFLGGSGVALDDGSLLQL